jgi:uncharacterized protein (TIGR00251 family)
LELHLDSARDGVFLPLKVSAGASREGVTGVHAGRLKVVVRAAPERGKANRSVIALLAKALQTPRRDLEIAAGATSPVKTLLVRGMTEEELLVRIGRVLEG